eukprot:2062478-Pleurochrysis_carterae.AAC.1
MLELGKRVGRRCWSRIRGQTLHERRARVWDAMAMLRCGFTCLEHGDVGPLGAHHLLGALCVRRREGEGPPQCVDGGGGVARGGVHVGDGGDERPLREHADSVEAFDGGGGGLGGRELPRTPRSHHESTHDLMLSSGGAQSAWAARESALATRALVHAEDDH